MEPKVKRGGKREGSGRKPKESAVITSSITLPPELWERLDALRGDQSRGAFLAEKLRRMRL